MEKIVLIVPYFGKLPESFQLWLNSAKANRNFQFFIFTDDRTVYNVPENVKFYYESFNDCKKRVQRNFDFEISLENPYKLCDFRPCYGEIFSEYITKFDWWGYCDTDVIFGNLSKFVTKSALKNNDKIYTHGHLTLIKNNEAMNSLYKMSNPMETGRDTFYWKDVLSKPWAFRFDEYPGVSLVAEKLCVRTYNKIDFADVWRKSFRFQSVFKQDGYKKQIYQYKENSLFRISLCDNEICFEEIAYVHLQKREMCIANKQNIALEDIKELLIVPNLFDFDSKLSVDYFEKNTKNPLKNTIELKLLKSVIFRKIKEFIRVRLQEREFKKYKKQAGFYYSNWLIEENQIYNNQ
ncbi:MAG: hypothetical protein LBM95_01045 [Lactobacillales bacterium]|nr:hypothetical protein [Lactobacillales bacterium]